MSIGTSQESGCYAVPPRVVFPSIQPNELRDYLHLQVADFEYVRIVIAQIV